MPSWPQTSNGASAALNLRVEHDLDLVEPWSPAANGAGGVTITQENDGFGSGIDRVTVRIPSTGPDHFVRLVVPP